MDQQPQRLSVLAQTVDLLRSGISQGRWKEVLPQERKLCDELGISRSTLRRALSRIETLGLIDAGQRGMRRRILSKPGERTSTKLIPKGRRITWLTTEDTSMMPSPIKALFIELLKRLNFYSYDLELLTIPKQVLANPEKHMAEFIREHPRDAWILQLMPPSIQRWFSEHLPKAFIFGSRAEGVDLGGIRIDQVAIARHAASHLSRLGHTHLALARKEGDLTGETNIEQTFRDALDDGGRISIIRSPEDPDLMHAAFEKVFLVPADERPTALLCSTPRIAAFSLTWLLSHGLRVPDDVSVMGYRSQAMMNYLTPKLSYYAVHEHTIVPAALPPLLDLIQTGTCSTNQITIMPEFIPGHSIGPAPKD